MWSTNKVSVLYLPLYEYFYFPSETEVRRKMEVIDPERIFCKLI